MPDTQDYTFRRVTMNDRSLLGRWRAFPHVREWWGPPASYTQDELDDRRVRRWIVAWDQRPFAFIQDYTVHGWDDHPFAHLPGGCRGIDQYIGEPDMLGLGHGSALIAARMRALFKEGAPMIVTDPHPDNSRAIAVYRKLGFDMAGPAKETRWGLILPMIAPCPTVLTSPPR